MGKHPKMPISQRAKQFLPFGALTGFEEALQKVEREHENFYLSDNSQDTKIILKRIITLNPVKIKITYENDLGRKTINCFNTDLNLNNHGLKVLGRKISFNQIKQVKLIDNENLIT